MTAEFRSEDVDAGELYRTLAGAIVPRPIGWISTVDPNGRANIAPYSFFGVACVDPPMIQFAPGTTADGDLKDTVRNIRDSGEFVHNLVTEDTLEQMHKSSARFPADESEFDQCDIEREPARTVSPPRVAASPIAFECTLHRALELGTHTLIIGEIQHLRIDENVQTAEGKLDIDRFDGVGRLTGGRYVTLDSQVSLGSLKDEDFPKGA
jgi:flavin reductase (DIM6/NTAB) family NADH-FMN oxidoreductase RutF